MADYILKLAEELGSRMVQAGAELDVVAGHAVTAPTPTGSSSHPGFPVTAAAASSAAAAASASTMHVPSSASSPSSPPVKAAFLTLSIMQRKAGAGAPLKYLGHGRCDKKTRSHRLAAPTSDPVVLAACVQRLYNELACPAADLRGIGIHVKELSHPALQLQQAGGGGGGGGAGSLRS